MRYVTWQDFTLVYADAMTQTEFDRIEYDAETIVDNWVRTVDGVDKLRVAFPTKAEDVEAVKRCVMALALACKEMEDYERKSVSDTGIVASVSSGTESMSFQRGGSALARATADDEAKAKYFSSIVRRYLAGHADKNGVNLLFGGFYPVVLKDGEVNVS